MLFVYIVIINKFNSYSLSSRAQSACHLVVYIINSYFIRQRKLFACLGIRPKSTRIKNRQTPPLFISPAFKFSFQPLISPRPHTQLRARNGHFSGTRSRALYSRGIISSCTLHTPFLSLSFPLPPSATHEIRRERERERGRERERTRFNALRRRRLFPQRARE